MKIKLTDIMVVHRKTGEVANVFHYFDAVY